MSSIYERYYTARMPAKQVLIQQENEVYATIRFSAGSCVDGVFAPEGFDARQIVGACREGGLKGVILVCKLPDGFCLWPSTVTEYNTKNAPCGDVVRAFSEACAEMDMKFGVSLPHEDVRDPREYRKQLREVLSQYGPMFEVQFSEAEADKSDFSWDPVYGIVRQMQPDAVISGGPDRRRCNCRQGILPDDSTIRYTPVLLLPGHERPKSQAALNKYLLYGRLCGGMYFVQAECEYPLTTPEKMREAYLHTVGNGGVLNIQITLDNRGLVSKKDQAHLRAFSAERNVLFSQPVLTWLVSDGEQILVTRKKPFNLIEFAEDVSMGERVKFWKVEAKEPDGSWRVLTEGRIVGFRRLRLLETPCNAVMLRITLTGGNADFRTWMVPQGDTENE